MTGIPVIDILERAAIKEFKLIFHSSVMGDSNEKWVEIAYDEIDRTMLSLKECGDPFQVPIHDLGMGAMFGASPLYEYKVIIEEYNASINATVKREEIRSITIGDLWLLRKDVKILFEKLDEYDFRFWSVGEIKIEVTGNTQKLILMFLWERRRDGIPEQHEKGILEAVEKWKDKESRIKDLFTSKKNKLIFETFIEKVAPATYCLVKDAMPKKR